MTVFGTDQNCKLQPREQVLCQGVHKNRIKILSELCRRHTIIHLLCIQFFNLGIIHAVHWSVTSCLSVCLQLPSSRTLLPIFLEVKMSIYKRCLKSCFQAKLCTKQFAYLRTLHHLAVIMLRTHISRQMNINRHFSKPLWKLNSKKKIEYILQK